MMKSVQQPNSHHIERIERNINQDEKSKNVINGLSSYMLRSLLEYLNISDGYQFTSVNRELNELRHTPQFNWRINSQFAEQFICDSKMETNILQSLNHSKTSTMIFSYSFIKNHHISKLDKCTNLIFKNCKEITTLSNLNTNLRNLQISNCSNMKKIYNLFNLQVLKIEGNLDLIDASNFVSLQQLELKNCTIHHSFMKLIPRKLTKLEMNDCHNRIDLSVFINLTDLSIIEFNTINTSLPLLPKLQRLKVGNIHNLQVLLHDLTNLITLDLSYNLYVNDLSSLIHLRELNLTYCTNISNISKMVTLQKLRLCYSPISDLSTLTSLYYLKLGDCCNVFDLSSLVKLLYLEITYTSVTNLSTLVNLHTFKIGNFQCLPDISQLHQLQFLEIYNTSLNHSVSNLHSLRKLKIYNCALITLSDLINLKKMSVSKSFVRGDVANLTNLVELSLMNCNYQNLGKLPNLQKLKLGGHNKNMITFNSLTKKS